MKRCSATKCRQETGKQYLLRKSCPVVIDDLLCVGDRPAHKSYPSIFERQVTMPIRHPITDLITAYYHGKESHVDTSHFLAAVGEHYRSMKGNSLVGIVIGRCAIFCRIIISVGQKLTPPMPLYRRSGSFSSA